jgi:hypothetical protein
MNDFKTMIAEALAAGEDITSIVNDFTKAANEAEKEFEKQKQKEYEADLVARPWAYNGLRDMEDYAEKILDDTLTVQDAVDLFLTVALQKYPAKVIQNFSRKDATSLCRSMEDGLKIYVKVDDILENKSMKDNDKVAAMLNMVFDGLVQPLPSTFVYKDDPGATATTANLSSSAKKTVNPDSLVIEEFLKNL